MCVIVRPGRAALAALVAAVMLFATVHPARAAAVAVEGTSSVELAPDPEHQGYWLYTLDVRWDLRRLPVAYADHVSFFLNLDLWECTCACDEGMVVFPEVAGVGTGNAACHITYTGGYECKSSSQLDTPMTEIRFLHDEACRAVAVGSATLKFYSRFQPDADGEDSATLGLRTGELTSTGIIGGVLPRCECNSSVQSTSWGMVKALYR